MMIRNKDFVHNTIQCKSWKWYLFPRPFDKLVPLYPYIYTSKTIRDSLMSDHNSLDLQLEFTHAVEHIHQQKQVGIVIWLGTFLLRKSFRMKHELAAISEEMKFLKENNFVFDIDKAAEKISGNRYFRMMNFDEAKILLTDMWKNI